MNHLNLIPMIISILFTLLVITIIGFNIHHKNKRKLINTSVKKTETINKPCRQYVFTYKPGSENSNHVIVKNCKDEVFGFLVNMDDEISIFIIYFI